MPNPIDSRLISNADMVTHWGSNIAIAPLSSPPPLRDKFWSVSMPEEGKTNTRYRPEGADLAVHIGNEHEGKMLVMGRWISRYHAEYSIYRGLNIRPSELMVKFSRGLNSAILGESYEVHTTENGIPMRTTRDSLRLLIELKGYIESEPGLTKKSRYVNLIKPMLDGFIHLAKVS